MGAKTGIEWTDCTDNIIVVKSGGWFCVKISPGCWHCYAEALNQSTYFGGNKLPYSGKPPELLLRRDILARWARQTRPRKHFVASMTDVFGEWVPPEWAFEFLDAMTAAPRQTFQVLTKRPAVARLYIAEWLKVRQRERLPDNIWMGATVEDQTRANERIPELVAIPARVRFLSCEPLLSEVDLTIYSKFGWWSPLTGEQVTGSSQHHDGPRIHWVIAGGESGKHARPMHPEWARSLRDQCLAAKVPFFFKQWGEWTEPLEEREDIGPDETEELTQLAMSGKRGNSSSLTWDEMRGARLMARVGKRLAGRMLDGREWSEFPTLTAA